MSFRTKLLSLSIPIQKEMQKLHPPLAQTKVADAERALLTMLPGDILLSREAWHFTNAFIPGFWSHAAIFGFDKNQTPSVVEAVAPCVQIVDWRDWVIEKQNWCVMRPMTATTEEGQGAFDYALTQKGRLYDYTFSKNNGLLFCSELAYDSWDTSSPWAQDIFVKKMTFGEWSVCPDDFYNAAQSGKLKVILEHRDK